MPGPRPLNSIDHRSHNALDDSGHDSPEQAVLVWVEYTAFVSELAEGADVDEAFTVDLAVQVEATHHPG